ncbi:MAG: hypothetical protein ACFC03_01755 [Candidatus Malihini olakiniferum]
MAGIKYLNRLEKVLIRQEIETQIIDDTIVLDTVIAWLSALQLVYFSLKNKVLPSKIVVIGSKLYRLST